jgi:hypothetical protein
MQPGPRDQKDSRMQDIDFGLTDAEYWSTPIPTPKDLIRQLWKTKRDTLAIGAPSLVALNQRETLPLAVLRAGPYDALAKFGLRDHALVTVVDLERNRVLLGRIPSKPTAKAKPPSESPNIREGDGSEYRNVELRNALELPWRPATLIATVIARDLSSNRVTITLGPSSGSYQDPEVARFIANQWQRATPTAVSPRAGTSLPRYEQMAGSPEIPAECGVVLRQPNVAVNSAGASSILRGAFRLRVREHERVKAEIVEGAGRREVPTAVVGITLVVTGSNHPTVGVLRLDVPSWDKLDAKEPIATGYFAIDLLTEKLIGPRTQTYFVYAFSGEHLVGPISAALVADTTSVTPFGR